MYFCLLRLKDFTFVTPPEEYPATGTGTLVIQLEDVNDNAPTIDEDSITVRPLHPVYLFLFSCLCACVCYSKL